MQFAFAIIIVRVIVADRAVHWIFSLGDSIASSTRIRFSVHTGVITSHAILGGLHHQYVRV